MVDSRVLKDYLEYRGISELNLSFHAEVSDIKDTDTSKFSQIENEAK